MSDDVKVTVTLPRQTVDKIRMLAAVHQTSLADAVVESVNLNEAISASERAGAKILIRQPNGATTWLRRVAGQNLEWPMKPSSTRNRMVRFQRAPEALPLCRTIRPRIASPEVG